MISSQLRTACRAILLISQHYGSTERKQIITDTEHHTSQRWKSPGLRIALKRTVFLIQRQIRRSDMKSLRNRIFRLLFFLHFNGSMLHRIEDICSRNPEHIQLSIRSRRTGIRYAKRELLQDRQITEE